MQIKEVLREASESLKAITDRAKYEAEILMCHYLECDRIYLHINHHKEIDTKDYFDMIHQRLEHKPIEYITNSVSFYSEEFFIDCGALIPRPETEILIDEVLPYLKSSDKIVEIGVGSGIISIMLSKLTGYCIDAIDISDDALKIAKENILRFELNDRVHLYKSDLLNSYDKEIDIIVSNPPYIEDGLTLDKPLGYEPQNALYGGKVGDEILQKIIDIAYEKDIRVLACEMGYDQKDKIQNYIDGCTYFYKELRFYKDLAGHDRGFILVLK
jgi:release factor glutamine methyltransferase